MINLLFQYVLVHIRHILGSESTSRRLQGSNAWIVPNNPLPRADYGMITVIYNDTIYLLGGNTFPRQSIEFDPISNTFIDHGTNASSTDINSGPSYGTYAQIGPLLFMMKYHPYGHSGLYRYHLATQETVMMVDIKNDGFCLTSFNNMIFIVGGDDSSSSICSTSVYHVNGSHLGWTSRMFCSWGNTEYTEYRSTASGCIVNQFDEALYSIGHYGVQKISTINIFNHSWSEVGFLPEITHSPAVVVYNNDIWVMETNSQWVGSQTKSVYVIDGVTNDITFVGSMSYEVYQPSVLLYNHTIYLFGGRNDSSAVDAWQFFQMYTNAPTMNPTLAPTMNPTLAPTIRTMLPSMTPIQSTSYPSISPTWNPSKNPTYGPTMFPTIGPTSTPSVDVYVPTFVLSTESTTYDEITASSNNDALLNKLILIGSILFSLSAFLLVVILIIYVVNKWKQKMVAQITQQVTAKVNMANAKDCAVTNVNKKDVNIVDNIDHDKIVIFEKEEDTRDLEGEKYTIEGNIDERNKENLSDSDTTDSNDDLWKVQKIEPNTKGDAVTCAGDNITKH